MKKVLNFILRVINVLYKVLPFFLGVYCYYPIFSDQDSLHPFLDAVYASIRLYGGDTEDGIQVPVLLEVARFMAIIAMIGILINLFNKLNDIIKRVKLIDAGATVVYGDSDYADHVFGTLTPRLRIRGEDAFIKNASKYLLMFSRDTDNLAFYSRNYEQLKDKQVYIMLDNISRQNIESPMIRVFSIAENCARQYWKKHYVTKDEKIAIIGFGNVGQNILHYGLQLNLIDTEQHFEYHIYGDGTRFRREHTELEKMAPDEIEFHNDGIYDPTVLAQFDRIIICEEDNGNVETLSRLLAAAPVKNPIFIYSPNGDIITELFGKERVICFGTADEIASADMILNERAIEAARRQNDLYAREHPESGQPWEKLTTFKRYSNISSVDYSYVIERLLKDKVPVNTIAELEHIRWCRYHYLNNWKYGPQRDDTNRIHNLLVPFSELSEEERRKDYEAIKSKLPDIEADEQQTAIINGIVPDIKEDKNGVE